MIGYFKVVDSNGKELAKYKYTAVTNKLKMALRKRKDIKLFCCCNEADKLEMRISSDFKIYPAEKYLGELHDPACPKYYRPKQEELWSIKKTKEHIYYHQASAQATAGDYLQEINQITYKRLVEPEFRLPDNYKDFNKRVNATLKYINTFTGEILYNIALTNNFNVDKCAVNQEYFAFGLLASHPKVTPFNKSLLYLDIIDCFGRKNRFYADRGTYEEEKKQIYAGYTNIIVCGFAYKKAATSKIMMLSDFAVRAIDNAGILL